MNDPHRTPCAELALADRFRLARRRVIALDGRRIRSVFAMPVPGGSIMRIHRHHATHARPQGLHLSSRVDLVVNGHRAPAPLRDGRQRLTIFCDRTGLEVFASDGLTYVPMPFQPTADAHGLAAAVKGGPAKFLSLQVHELKSAWARK